MHAETESSDVTSMTDPPKKGSVLRLFHNLLRNTFILILILILGVWLLISFAVDGFVKHHLKRAANQATSGVYQLQIDDVDVNLWKGEIYATDLVLEQDESYVEWLHKQGKNTGPTRVKLQIPILLVNHVRWLEFLQSHYIRIGEVFIDFPELEVYQNAQVASKNSITYRDKKNTLDSIQSPFVERIPKVIGQFASALRIDTLSINQGKVRFQSKTSKGISKHLADSVCLSFREINIDSAFTYAWHKVLYSEDIQFSLSNYRYFFADGIYTIAIKRIKSSSEQASLLLEGFNLAPRISDVAFARRKVFEHDRFKLEIPRIECRESDFRKLVQGDVMVQAIHIGELQLNVFRDKRFPRNPNQQRKTPQEAFQKLKNYLRIDTIGIHNASIVYGERAPESEKAGKVFFNQINVSIYNLTNDPERMTVKTPVFVQATGKVMGKGQLELNLTIPLLANDFQCRYTGGLRQMEAANFNRIFTPNENLRIENGTVDKVTFAVNVKNGVATGHLKAIYHDLKLSVLDQEKKKERKLLSIIGNLIIKGSNTSDNKRPPKIGEIEYVHTREFGFLGFLWRSLKMGLLTTLTPMNTELIRKQQEIMTKRKEEPMSKK
jgi:hypothetical protein